MSRQNIAAIIIIVLSMLLIGCTAKPSTTSVQQTATVQRGNLNVNITTSGNLAAAESADLTFGSAGTVKEVLVKIGDRVEKDQVLAKLDTADLEISLATAQINVKQARISLENAKVPTTSGSGTSAPDPLNIELKELSLKNTIANEAAAAKKLAQATILAPFAGKITEVNVEPEKTVSATAVAVRMIDPDRFYTQVSVNEMDIYNLKINTKATVRIVAQSTYNFPAKVTLITETPTITLNVVTYKVRVDLDPLTQSAGNQSRAPAATQQASTAQSLQLREGLTVTVYINTSEKNDVLIVPTRAIASRSGKSYVQVLSTQGTPEERQITVGISDGERTEVVSGLTAGEQVAITNASTVTTPTSQQQPRQTIVVPGVGGIGTGGR